MSLNLLLSYAFHAKTDLARIRAAMPCGRIMIDSGAFTAYTKGQAVDIVAYAEYLEHWRGCWDHAITLDAIGDPVVAPRPHTTCITPGVRPVIACPVFDPSEAEWAVTGTLRASTPASATPRTRMLGLL